MSFLKRLKRPFLRLGLPIFAVMFVFALPSFAYADTKTLQGVSSLLSPDGASAFFMTGLATIFNAITWGLGQFLVLVMGALIIPILGYNSFGDSYVVSLGWPLVRDAVNMFVILILLYMAFKTMLGGGAQMVQQQLPRLFLAVAAVNFSRTICLLIIDASQAVMFTFVNALTQIAAGNFVNMLQINALLDVKETAMGGTVVPLSFNGAAVLATAYLNMVMVAIILAVFILLAGVFIYRIVLLWILIVLSPLAFFLKGIEGIAPAGGGKGQEWWEKFTGAVMIGPVLTFFLWLSLAASSSGKGMAVSENFPLPGPGETVEWSALLTEAFKIEQLLSMFLGLAIILIGFQVASSYASSLGGVAAKFINEDFGKSLIKGIGFTAGARTVSAGARTFERKTGAGAAIGKGITQAGGSLAATGGVAGLVAGAALGKVGASLQKRASAVSDADKKSAKESFATSTIDEKTNDLMLVEKNKAPLTSVGQEKMRLSMFDLMQNKDAQDAMLQRYQGEGMTKEKATERLESLKGTILQTINANPSSYIGDDKDRKKQFTDIQLKNMHLLKDKDGKFDEKSARKLIDDSSFKPSQLSASAVADSNVQRILNERTMGVGVNGEPISAFDQIKNGLAGSELRDAANGKGARLDKSNAETIGAAIKNKYIKPDDITVKDLDRNEVIEGVAEAGTDMSQIGNAMVRNEIMLKLDQKRQSVPADSFEAMKYQKAQVMLAEEKEASQILKIDIDQNTGRIIESGTKTDEANRTAILRDIAKNDIKQSSKFNVEVQAAYNTKTHNSVTRELAQNVTTGQISALDKEYRLAQKQQNKKEMEKISATVANITKSVEIDINEIKKSNKQPSKEHLAKLDQAEMLRRITKTTEPVVVVPGPTVPPPPPAGAPAGPTVTPGPATGGTP